MDIESIIAIYGALLSTALLLYEILKQRKRLTIILEHIAWYERVHIIITNSSRRSISLSSMSMEVFDIEKSFWELVPQNALFDNEQRNELFPLTIKKGESISLLLGPVLSDNLIKNRLQARITITDSEGKKFKEFKARTFDAKWGTYHYIS